MKKNENKGGEIVPITDIQNIIAFIFRYIRSDEWCKEYSPSPDETERLQALLQHEFLQHYSPQNPQTFQHLALLGLEFVKRLPSYIQLQQAHYRELAAEELQKANVPLSQYPQVIKNLRKVKLQPSDCAALKDWPEGRRQVAGTGRLENAGQFMERLLRDKLYDEAMYGKLYMHDLRTINPKLYLALSQWQNRYNITLLKNKSDQMDALEDQAHQNPQTLSFQEKTRLSSARSRKK